MNTRLPAMLLMAALSMFFVTIALADSCDTAFGQAHELFESARSAFKRADYESAERWYKEASTAFGRVAVMTGCRCPKIAGVAAKNSVTSKTNAELCRSTVARKEEYARTMKEREEKAQQAQDQEQSSAPVSESKRLQRNPAFDAVAGSPDDISAYSKILTRSTTPPPAATNSQSDDHE